MRSLTRSTARLLGTAAGTVLLVLALAACGNDGDGDGADEGTSQQQESPSTDVETGASAQSDPTGSVTAPTTAPSGGPVDASAKAFCEGLKEVGEIASGANGVANGVPTEVQWKQIQQAYADLGEIGAPDGATDRQREGFEIVVDAITGLSYAEAKREFGGKGNDSLPGVSPAEEEKANEFFAYVGPTCAGTMQ